MLTKNDADRITRLAHVFDVDSVNKGQQYQYTMNDLAEIIFMVNVKLKKQIGSSIPDFLFGRYPADMQSAFDDWMKAEAKNRQY